MATRTISVLGGNWDDIAAWIEAAVPTNADDVVATALSGNLTFNLNGGACRSIDLTGYLGTITHNAGVGINVGGTTDPPSNKALEFPSSGWTYTLGNAATSGFSFVSTSATQRSVNPGGKPFGNTLFNGTGASWKLTGDLLLGATATLTVAIAVFDANGFNVTCGLFVSSSTSLRTITMGSGTWTVTGNNGTVWSMSNVTNLTFNRGNALVFNYSGSTGTRTIAFGGTEANAPDVAVSAGTDTISTTSMRTRNLTFDGFGGAWSPGTAPIIYGNLAITAGSSGMSATGSFALTFSATSGTKTITTSGVTIDCPITINGVGGTFQLADHLTMGASRTLTLTNGTLDFNGKNVSVGKFASNNANIRTLTMGSGTLTLTGTGTVWTTATATNLTLNYNTASVVLTGASGTIAGSPTFYNFTDAVAGATLTFTDGITVTVTNSLTLTGAVSQLLTLQGSGAAGWTLAVPATQSISYVSVSRSTATGNTAAAGATSTDGGNNTNWTFGSAARGSVLGSPIIGSRSIIGGCR